MYKPETKSRTVSLQAIPSWETLEIAQQSDKALQLEKLLEKPLPCFQPREVPHGFEFSGAVIPRDPTIP